MKGLFLHGLLVAVSMSIALAQPASFEEPPTVKAADLLPAEVLSGGDYTIDPNVVTDGFSGTFYLRSKFGDFECAGREMLYTRLSELKALEELEKVSKTKEFAKAVGNSAVEPVKAAVKIVTQPGRSAATVPVGAAHLFGDVVKGMYDTAKGVGHIGKKSDDPKPPPSRDDPIGYNKMRNEWAARLSVDPYTTNRVLAVKLNHLATIDFGTDKAVGAGMSFGLGPLGPIGEYVSYLPDVDEHLLTSPPSDVTKANARRLRDLGVSKSEMKPLLENKWFSPTLQIRYVNALVRFKGVNGIGTETELAGAARSEEEARFLCGCLEMLQRYHTSVAPAVNLTTCGDVPAALTEDGRLVVAAPLDMLAWTPTAASFAAKHEKGQPAELCTDGIVTQRAKEGFISMGWKITPVRAPWAR